MRQISSKLLDVYKKYIFYGKEVNKELFEILFTSFLSILYDIINDIRSSLQIKASNIELLEYILQMNVDKLKTRYPEAYIKYRD